jgi:hypothetical protein
MWSYGHSHAWTREDDFSAGAEVDADAVDMARPTVATRAIRPIRVFLNNDTLLNLTLVKGRAEFIRAADTIRFPDEAKAPCLLRQLAGWFIRR